jgi:hypothetical protein
MADKEWSTFGILSTLLRDTDLLPTQFVALCSAYGIEISNATLSRALKAGKFSSHEVSETLRPLVLGLENLVEKAALVRLAFDETEHIKLLLDLLNDGHELSVNIKLKEKIEVSEANQ